MNDGFSGAPAGPYVDGFDVTPSDTVDFTKICNGLYVTGAGTLTVVLQSGYVLALGDVPAGSGWPFRCKRVNATGTTATGIKALT